jgi:hypothetical protein
VPDPSGPTPSFSSFADPIAERLRLFYAELGPAPRFIGSRENAHLALCQVAAPEAQPGDGSRSHPTAG